MTDTATQQQARLWTYEDAVAALRSVLARYVAVGDCTPDTPFPALPAAVLVPDGLPVLALLHDAVSAAERALLPSLG